jgi:anti-anti-sigma factor
MSVAEILVIVGLIYTVVAYTVDLLFSVLGIFSIKNQRKKFKTWGNYHGVYPSLNIVIPCFNEEKTIEKGIDFLKDLEYPNLKITILNDGSKDRTLDILKQKLTLRQAPLSYHPHIPTQTVKSMFVSSEGEFLVVDKFNGGKADTLNAGINLCESDLVCCVDADTIIKKDALKRMVLPFLHDRRVVAAGGSVRIKNDSESLGNFPEQLRVPEKILPALQAMEYIRSINIARNALSIMNANLIISGAFGIFRTDILKQIGGYEKFSKGEDLELLTRIHFFMLQQKKPYRISQVYSADAFTQAPDTYRELKSQRKRWQVGLVSTLRTHFLKFFKYPFSPITLFSLPYYILFEVISPVLQLLVTLSIPFLVFFRVIHINYLILLLVSVIYNAMINTFFLMLDFGFSPYYRVTDKLKLISSSLMEPFFYHQLNCFWKLLGTLEYLKKVFVRAAWTPPRGDKGYQSQIGKMSLFLGHSREKGLEMVADYKSLYHDAIVILSLSGSFETSDIPEFERLVRYLHSKNRKKIILEFQSLEEISSDALAMLVQLSMKLKKEQGALVVIHARERIEDEFKISNAIKAIKVFKNYSDAIKEVKYG